MGEINKSMPVSLSDDVEVTLTGTKTVTVSGTAQLKWIDGTTEPAAPDGYVRFPDLDLEIPIKVLDTLVTVKLWAFKQV